ncbi:MAG: 50S ribosomal protein L3 N(5)-glutamine methyltransferase [Betaproteobacteria bacterium]|nr:50S ribosomal protein L3 N(5)-glutamine methyltransferase [Betaproteobacteria bacterium]
MTAFPTELESVRDWLRHAVSRFQAAKLTYGHGTDNAFDEAVFLVLATLNLPLDQLEPFLDARLTGVERAALHHALDRRTVDRVPVPYLTHQAWLGRFKFYVDERVIIPRSFIAELLEERLAPWVTDPDRISTVLDLCTGSGCLAILLADAFPNADVDAIDISADALAVAQHNVAEYGLQDRINLVRSDLFQNVNSEDKTYDLIISNPPYVTQAAMSELPAEYRHEPEVALAAGEDGLEAIRQIIDSARAYLNVGGILIVEAGHNRDLVESAFTDLPFTWLRTATSDDKVFLLRREDLPV